MFQGFSAQASEVMRLANEEALWHQHEYVGSEHILCGLIREGNGAAATVLATAGVDAERLRQQIAKLLKRGPATAVKKRPLTPRALTVVGFAVEQAKRRQRTSIETEDLLLGVLQEHDGIAATVLTNAGVRPERLADTWDKHT